jgi:FkbM family methyltransferase
MELKKNIRGVELLLSIDSAALQMYAQGYEKVEPENFDFIDSLASTDLYLDLGACEGRYAVYAAKKGIPTIAVEPEDKNYNAMCQNIALNKLVNIQPHKIAVGKYSHSGRIVVGQNNAGGHHKILEDSCSRNSVKNSSSPRQAVEIKALDDMGWNPTAIKIDVDGSELDALEGGEKTIKNARQVLIELSTIDEHYAKCRWLLVEWGFKDIRTYQITYPYVEQNLFNYWLIKA